jgi:hypothetical protein
VPGIRLQRSVAVDRLATPPERNTAPGKATVKIMPSISKENRPLLRRLVRAKRAGTPIKVLAAKCERAHTGQFVQRHVTTGLPAVRTLTLVNVYPTAVVQDVRGYTYLVSEVCDV